MHSKLLRTLVVVLVLVFIVSQFANPSAQSQQTQPASTPTTSAGHVYRIHITLHRVSRIDQFDPAQYNSPSDLQTWGHSDSSTAAMAEVLDAYGQHYRIADVLAVQVALGEITPRFGLKAYSGIARTMARFGFQTQWGVGATLGQLVQVADTGTPVIVYWPTSRYPGGLWLVLESGNVSTVQIADSRDALHVVSRVQFMRWWGGFCAVATPLPTAQL